MLLAKRAGSKGIQVKTGVGMGSLKEYTPWKTTNPITLRQVL